MRKMMHVSLLAAFVVFTVAALTFAQAPDVAWAHTYTANSAALSLHELPDSGFVLGGYVVPEGEGYRDMFIVRTNSVGDTLWTSAIGQPDRAESATCLYPTPDGGFILTGAVGQEEPYTWNSDVHLVKTNQDGALEWQSTFGAQDVSESGQYVVPAAGGGYLIAAGFWNEVTGYDLWLLRTDHLGILLWPQLINWPDADYAKCIGLTADSGFAITGYTQSFDDEYDYDGYILKLDKYGVESWALPYGSAHPYDETANHICYTSDGGYLMCGYIRDASIQKDIYVVKTDRFGATEWTSRLGGTYHDEGWCCIETSDGGYAVSGSWYRNGNWQVGLIKYNSVGDTMWTAFWGDPANGHTPYGLVQTADNGYAVGGMMSGNVAAFLVKFEAEPEFGVFTTSVADLSIPVDELAPARDTITVSIDEENTASLAAANLRVVGVKVTIDTLEHPNVEELTVTIAHEGIEVTLVAEGLVTGANLTGTLLSDASGTLLCSGIAPYTGTFRPHEQLNAFYDTDPAGDWIISVSDGASGNDGVLKAWGITLLTDIALDVNDPQGDGLFPDYHLSQCYPNPFNPSTTLEYSIPRRSDVTLEIYNILGQKVVTLVDESQAAGEHRVTWNGNDSDGAQVSTGIYLYRLQAGDYTDSKKMVLLK